MAGIAGPNVKSSAVCIVAHPDDETLWAGRMILMRPSVLWTVVSLCRGGDPDRAPRFRTAMNELGARGIISDLDDGPEQRPLPPGEVREVVASLVPPGRHLVAVTHGPEGEYTRHRRHEETSRAVAELWLEGGIEADELWMFAYGDAGGARPPRPLPDAHVRLPLTAEAFERKRAIVRGVYGFAEGSFETNACFPEEAFWRFASRAGLAGWLSGRTVA